MAAKCARGPADPYMPPTSFRRRLLRMILCKCCILPSAHQMLDRLWASLHPSDDRPTDACGSRGKVTGQVLALATALKYMMTLSHVL